MNIEYRQLSVSEYNLLRESVGWWSTDAQATTIALRSSLLSVVAVNNNTTIDCGRICGGGGLYFYTQDLIIHPDYQNQGVGKQLMQALMDYLALHTRPGAYIALMAAEGLEKYYEEFGYKARKASAPGMYQIL